MSNLLSRSKMNLDMSKVAWKKVSYDDVYLSGACYMLQQCIEMGLKYALEINGIGYPRTHNIGSLLEILQEHGISYDELSAFQYNRDTYTSWEATSRYNDSFIASAKLVEETFRICDKMIERLSNLSTVQSISPLALKWCRANAPEAAKDLPDNELWQLMRESYYRFGKD